MVSLEWVVGSVVLSLFFEGCDVDLELCLDAFST